MKTVKDIVNEINEAGLYATCCVEDEIDIGGAEEVAVMDYDEHRWYVIGTVVYKLGDSFFGVCGPISLKSESMGFGDAGIECTAFEMEAVPSVTYKIKELK